MGPLVSIAMAAYNGEKYIWEQLRSIVDQTYPNIEVIITDDDSSDNTLQIIKEFQKKYSYIFLFSNKTNAGVTKTFENSIRHCKGEYIAISDQDDIWALNKIEVMVNEVGKEDALYSNSQLVDKEGRLLEIDFKSLMNLQSYYSGAPFLLSNCVPGHTLLMKRDFLNTLLPFPDGVLFDRWISYCAAANNGLKYIDKPLVQYRQHETNAIGITGNSKNKTHRETNAHKFLYKKQELQTLATAPVKSAETKLIINRMLTLFNRKWSLQRSIFFFKHRDEILIIKNKSEFRKILYCIKMFFKPNY
ncbi:MAG: putative glycosyltransferase epsH [Chitinophagaceae bacterium]|nr:putative glycosyltransferase epsH [Chitinophagaceae bacterium]